MRHVLFVAFHYPPEASSSGVLRTLKYSRYLPDFGWRVSVITAEPSAYSSVDPSLEDQIPPSTQVMRTRYMNTKRHLSVWGIYPAILSVPDVWIGWMPWAVAAGRRLMGRDPFDLIYSTSPHATAHLIACRLSAVSRKPWVADFRDPWIEDPPEPGSSGGPVLRAANRWLEKLVVKRSHAVVTSTTYLRDIMRERYASEPKKKIRAIPNGYDEADFAHFLPQRTERVSLLRIVHAGNINSRFRDPRPFFAALGRMVASGRLLPSDIDIQFIGGGPYGHSTEVQAELRAAGLTGRVSFTPRVSYEQSLQHLSTADLLLLLQASDDTVGLVPAKLYEYLRSQKPTLALVKPGAVTEVLLATGGGWVADPADATSLDVALVEILQKWREGELASHRADLHALGRFDRRALTAQLATLFDELSPTNALRADP